MIYWFKEVELEGEIASGGESRLQRLLRTAGVAASAIGSLAIVGVMAFALVVLASTAEGAELAIEDFSVASSGDSSTLLANGVTRTITTSGVSGLAPVLNGNGCLDQGAAVPLCDMTNGVGDNSTVTFVYDGIVLPMIGDPLITLRVLLVDGNSASVELSGLAGGSALIPGGTAGVSYVFAGVGGTSPASLELKFSGDPGWDLAFDELKMEYQEVPEPATAGLAGLALVGLGLVKRHRRRRQHRRLAVGGTAGR